MAHAKLSASSYYRWGRGGCPGSVRQCEGLPDHTSSYADEGTKAHELAAKWLESGTPPPGIDDETREGLQHYVDAVLYDWQTGPKSWEDKIFIEQSFDLSSIHPDCGGTADAVVWKAAEKKLYVHDLKWGAGVPVEVVGSKQLRYYALGALLKLGAAAEFVEMVISQPRCEHPDGPVRRWLISADELLDFAADLYEDAKATEAPDAPLVPGEHCRFCKAAATCPALHSKATALAKLEFSPTVSYKPVDLAMALEWADKMSMWSKRVHEFAYGESMKGRTPPGWKLVEKRATRKWRDEVTYQDLARVSGLSPAEVVEDPKLKSPAQVEKLLAKGERPKLEQFYLKESSGMKLVRDTEAGEPIKLDPASEFERIP
jgi:hypothetical protein